MNKRDEARILIWDIETSPLITYSWTAYQANAIEVIEEMQMLCFAYKWLGDKKVKIVSQDDLKGYKPGVNNDKEVVKVIRELFNEADVVVAHNGDSYDQKVAQARMMVHGLQPPSPYKQIDTKKVAKKYGRFARNKLDDLSKNLGLGEKLHHEGWDMWKGVLAGKKQSWKMMKKYCIQDVALQEELYLKLRPWIANHPSMAVLKNEGRACPKCGKGPLRQCGHFITKTGRRLKYQCQACGGWSSGRLTNHIAEYTN